MDITTGAFYGCPAHQLGLNYRDVIEVGELTGESLSTPERHAVIFDDHSPAGRRVTLPEVSLVAFFVPLSLEEAARRKAALRT